MFMMFSLVNQLGEGLAVAVPRILANNLKILFAHYGPDAE